jgi:hypothetical protein
MLHNKVGTIATFSACEQAGVQPHAYLEFSTFRMIYARMLKIQQNSISSSLAV